MNEHPNYYAIVPANVRYDKGLRPNEKLLYGEITSLSNATGECWASNNYFAELYQVTPQAVSKWISNLQGKGYITVEIVYRDGTKEISKRIIRIVSTNDLEVSTKDCEGINKSLIPPKQKIKDNNTSNNKLNIKKIIDNYTDDDDLKSALMDFAEMRRLIKKPLTERAWKIITSKLDSVSSDISVKIACLNDSIEHNWLSVYPPKENGLKPQNKAQTDWAESWVQVTKCISLYGLSNGAKAMDTMDRHTKEAVKRMGWRNLCMSQNPVADRSNYKFVYETVIKELGD